MYHTLNGKNGKGSPQLTENEPRNQDILNKLESPKANPRKLSKRDDWSDATKELLDVLPQVWTRGLLYFLVIFVGIALPWAMFSQVEETGTARGRLEPQGKTIQLDAPVSGTVAKILVKEGEKNTLKAQLESKQAQSHLQEQQGSYDKIINQAASDIEQARLRWQELEESYKSLVHSGQLAVLKIEEQLKNLETDIATLKAEIAQSKSQISSLTFQLNQRVLKAPVAGTVFQLPLQGEGEVVQPGDMIAEIGRKGASLSLQAEMATTESGSLATGMAVKMKFDAYPFQDYGIVEGELVKISPTTEEIETPDGKITAYFR